MVEIDQSPRPDIHKLRFHPPWIGRLARATTYRYRHRPVIEELSASPYQTFLQYSADGLRSHWRMNWREVLAVGPFAKQTHRPVVSIPFILYGDIRSIVPSLDAMSEALAPAYAEFGILPDIFVFREQFVRELEQGKNLNWALTRRFSVSIGAP
jgi:hypothetical protein